MAAITVRNLDDDVKERLKARALRNGRSLEAEARVLLRDAVAEPRPQPKNWGTVWADRFSKYNLKESDLPRPDHPEEVPETFGE